MQPDAPQQDDCVVVLAGARECAERAMAEPPTTDLDGLRRRIADGGSDGTAAAD